MRESCTLLLSPEQAAQRLAVSPGTLRKWRCVWDGGPPFRKIGSIVRYSAEQLEQWLENLPTYTQARQYTHRESVVG